MIRTCLLALFLAGPAAAQTDPATIDKLADQYDDFAPAVEEKPLDELVPDTGPGAEDAQATSAETNDAAPDTHATETTAAPTPPGSGQAASDPGPADIPDGWARHAAHGLTFALPPDWDANDRDEMFTATSPGFSPKDGKGLGLSVTTVPAEDFEKDFLNDDAAQRAVERSPKAPLALGGGVTFPRAVLLPEDSGQPVTMEIIHATRPQAGAGYLVISIATPDAAELERNAPLLEQILGTFRLADPAAYKAATRADDPAAANDPVTTLGGLVTIRPPEGWALTPGETEATLRTDVVYSAYVTMRRGDAARAALDLDGLLQAPPRESAGEVLGQPASVFSGVFSYPGMQSGATMQRGKVRVYLLRSCLPDGSPVVIETAAAPGWLEDNDLAPVLGAVTAHWPEGMQPCHPAVSARAQWAMDGLFAYVLPEGFKTGRSRSSFWIRTADAPYASLGIGTGDDSFPVDFRLADKNPAGNGFIAPPETHQGEIMGEPALVFTGRGRAGEASRARHVALLERCLPGGVPVVVEMTADDDWLSANGGMDKLLAQKWLDLPENAKPCDPSLVQEAMRAAGVPATGAAPQTGASQDTPTAAAGASGSRAAPPTPQPSTPQPSAWQPVGDPVTGGLNSKLAVQNGPAKATAFRLESRGYLDRITTYHWNHGRGAAPGTIALRDEDGRLYGPWPARGAAGQGGVPNAYWHVTPNIVLPAGKYTVVDSDTSTWATNAEVGDRGIFSVALRRVVRPEKAGTAGDEPDAAPPANSPEKLFWQTIADSDDPADFRAYLRAYPDGLFAPLARNRLDRLDGGDTGRRPSAAPSAYYTPARGTAERAALMDAARIPVQRAVGQPVIFVVSTLRSDGNWAYLAATPVQPDGQPLDWRSTPMARDWAADMMSDVVMVVMRRDADGWRAVEHIIGPTDVAWLGWVDEYGWPRALFTAR
ncbi:hypothetical protein [Sediminimonas sp.]|uniref:hypothetical protein n=1 Tax=Sediminimonas sp. TaxID=2823379 RepID=UPI0025D342CA|nr:hypothetical protein [Sediminimonas sp.]